MWQFLVIILLDGLGIRELKALLASSVKSW